MTPNDLTLGLAFMAGLLSFISPCVLPLMPAYVSYLGARVTQQVSGELAVAGMPVGAGTKIQPNRAGLLAHGLMFVFGFTVVFVLFGIAIVRGVELLGTSVYDINQYIMQIGGVIVIFFGLHVLGVTSFVIRLIRARLPAGSDAARLLNWLQGIFYADTRRSLNPRNPYGFAGSALMGVVFAAGWTPCVGPIYGTILSVAATGSANTAMIMLTAYSLGLGIPFLLTAVALEQVRGLLKRLQRHMRLIEAVSGLFMIMMGYLLVSNQLSEISAHFSGLSVFSYTVEECGTGIVRGDIPVSDLGNCLQNGINYKYVSPAKTTTSERIPSPLSVTLNFDKKGRSIWTLPSSNV